MTTSDFLPVEVLGVCEVPRLLPSTLLVVSGELRPFARPSLIERTRSFNRHFVQPHWTVRIVPRQRRPEVLVAPVRLVDVTQYTSFFPFWSHLTWITRVGILLLFLSDRDLTWWPYQSPGCRTPTAADPAVVAAGDELDSSRQGLGLGAVHQRRLEERPGRVHSRATPPWIERRCNNSGVLHPSPPKKPVWTLGCAPPSHSPSSSVPAFGASMKWPGATRSGFTLQSNVGTLEECPPGTPRHPF
ncbi:hypothetical protein THAOC_19481 [Thalassiosira oceanica]|uniref:Uncharacterized protein n=1 Tax=Thalassiosira oceanica TaxID=159749 RepID=K0SP93_THAOC|nr:hypothetical protein THAOC_19481 [Thalassiosira oceanica]|eukprot:EJK60212.1 hypothetical protein THAOC_19481 [Thalassiosira oceanica]